MLGARLSAALGLFAALSTPALAWEYGETIDQMTDAKRARTVAESANGAIVIKCDKAGPDSLYVHVITKEYLGEGRNYGRRDLMIRFDTDQPQSSVWSYDDRSAILTDPAQVRAFLARLTTASKLTVRATTYEYSDVTFSVDVANVKPTLDRVAATCGVAL